MTELCVKVQSTCKLCIAFNSFQFWEEELLLINTPFSPISLSLPPLLHTDLPHTSADQAFIVLIAKFLPKRKKVINCINAKMK
jgi:hypothetical protein